MPFLTFQIKNAKVVRKGLENLRKKIQLISRKRIFDTATAIVREMKEEGSPVSYPIQWDSDKQRRAFFATDAFTLKGPRPKGYVNSHIPTKRKHGEKKWKVIKVSNEVYDIGNPLAHWKYVSGTLRSTKRQSKIHRGRWNLIKEVVERHVKRLPKRVRDSIVQIARREGFRSE